MNRSQREAIVLSLVEELRENGSWCGETAIQKATYFLNEVLRVPLDYSFVLYKYGPYSFELTEDLTALRADNVLNLEIRDTRYGPSYCPGRLADFVRKRFPKTIAKYQSEIEFVAKKLGPKSVTELERLATALYVQRRNSTHVAAQWATRIHELKPHISLKDADTAIGEVEEIATQAKSICK